MLNSIQPFVTDSFSLTNFIALLNAWPPEMIVVIEIMIYITFMLGLFKYYGKYGLFTYLNITLIVANIQVLKGSQFIFPQHPIAMGTLPFGTIGLSLALLTEYYGKTIALKGVQLGFITLGFFTLLMLTTVGIKPLNPDTLTPDTLALYNNHMHIKALFIPLPSILIASLISYWVSQYCDVVIFWFTKYITHQRWLGLRMLLSSSLSAFIDTCLFSCLAWKIFNPNPVGWETLLSVYIMGTYPLRLLCSFLLTPIIYIARYFLPKPNDEHIP